MPESWAGLLGGLMAAGAALASARYLLIASTRVNPTTGRYFADRLPGLTLLTLSGEYATDGEPATTFRVLARVPGVGWCVVESEERMLQAGFVGKEVLLHVRHFRWAGGRLRRYLAGIDRDRRAGDRVTVEAVTTYGLEPLGFVRPDGLGPPLHPPALWAAADADAAACAAGNLARVGILAHGPPGTGKTTFAKWLAYTYRLPVKMFVLEPEVTNLDILRRFARMPDRCLVLFEDFDSYFDGRTPRMAGEPKFTFDAFLNGLDGVFGIGEGVVFVMTANDLSRIDPALKDRPGRFKHVLHFGPIDGQTTDQRLNGPDATPPPG